MNAEQIRAEAVEVIARELFAADEPGNDQSFDDWAPRYRRKAAPYVDALAAAGLLPTGTETRAVDGGVEWMHGDGHRSTLPVYGRERRYFTECVTE